MAYYIKELVNIIISADPHAYVLDYRSHYHLLGGIMQYLTDKNERSMDRDLSWF